MGLIWKFSIYLGALVLYMANHASPSSWQTAGLVLHLQGVSTEIDSCSFGCGVLAFDCVASLSCPLLCMGPLVSWCQRVEMVLMAVGNVLWGHLVGNAIGAGAIQILCTGGS